MRNLLALTLALLTFAACARHEITRAEWESSSADQKSLIVRSLLGAEQVRESKGGQGRSFSRPVEQYVGEIDSRYAVGDARPVNDIWEELSDPPG